MNRAPQNAKLDASQHSQGLLGLAAIALMVILWAVAANVANSLFLKDVLPFELA